MLRVAVAALLVPIILVSPVLADAGESTAEKVRRLFHEGNDLMEKGEREKALEKYEAALAVEPKAKGPLYNGGLVAFLLGKYEVAIRHFKALKEILPEDAQVRAKLVQAYSGADKKKERDAEIEALYALRKETEDEDLQTLKFFCREQFEAGGKKVMVFEHFEWVGERAVRYRFVVLDSEGKEAYRISLGSYATMQGFAEDMGTVKPGQRYCHLDGYFPGNRHATYGFFAGEPPYDEIREKVVGILTKKEQALSSSQPGGGKDEDDEDEDEE